jgi:uncharacterized protein YutE (UPF0331/DUF86 family)
MINKDTIKAKLNILRENLANIKDILKLPDDKLQTEKISLSAMERYFQLMVDATVGTNEHIISEENLQVPNDYFGTFSILGKADILPYDFSQKIAPSVGLRNQLVHQYEKIDSLKVIQDIRANIHQYDEYLAYIINHYKLG